jgi:hypothetical protein
MNIILLLFFASFYLFINFIPLESLSELIRKTGEKSGRGRMREPEQPRTKREASWFSSNQIYLSPQFHRRLYPIVMHHCIWYGKQKVGVSRPRVISSSFVHEEKHKVIECTRVVLFCFVLFCFFPLKAVCETFLRVFVLSTPNFEFTKKKINNITTKLWTTFTKNPPVLLET